MSDSDDGPARATKCSPWLDNLRHLYEAGRSIETLAHWYSTNTYQMRNWLFRAGTKFRRMKKADQ